MDPVTMMAVSALVTAGTAGYSAKKQSDLGKKNEKLERQETDEQARRLGIQQDENLKVGRAAAGASGTRPGTGSQQTFISDVGKKQQAEMAWLKKAGASRAGINLEKSRAGAISTLGTGLASAGAMYGKSASESAGTNWWTTSSA